eukprot:Pgem_evm1s3351
MNDNSNKENINYNEIISTANLNDVDNKEIISSVNMNEIITTTHLNDGHKENIPGNINRNEIISTTNLNDENKMNTSTSNLKYEFDDNSGSMNGVIGTMQLKGEATTVKQRKKRHREKKISESEGEKSDPDNNKSVRFSLDCEALETINPQQSITGILKHADTHISSKSCDDHDINFKSFKKANDSDNNLLANNIPLQNAERLSVNFDNISNRNIEEEPLPITKRAAIKQISYDESTVSQLSEEVEMTELSQVIQQRRNQQQRNNSNRHSTNLSPIDERTM